MPRICHIALFAALTLICASCFVEDVGVEGSSCDSDDGEHPCPEGYNCVDEVCYPEAPTIAVACSADEDCPAGVCLEQAHVCVGCIRHGDCVSGLCHIPTHVCIGCKADYQCPSGVCDENSGMCEKSSTESDASGN